MNRYFAVVLLLCACLVSCKKDEEKSAAVEIAPVVEVVIAPVRFGRIDEVLRVTGRTQVLHQEHVNAPIGGKIIALSALEGANVKAGDVIAVIRTRESQAALEGAGTSLARASTPAQTQEAERALHAAEHSLNEIAVRAPFDGVVATRAVNMGEFISENSDVVTLLDLSTLYFMADVPVQSLSRIANSGTVQIAFAAFPDRLFPAVIDNINPQVDAASQMAKVRMKFSGPIAALRADMFGEGRITVGVHAAAALVPREAVSWNNETGETSVAVARDSIAWVIPVTVGIADSTNVEVVAPTLAPGTNIIVVGNHGLLDSTRITYSHTP